MVYSFLPVPFADTARQQLFAAMEAALLAEPNAPSTVLLGNLGAFAPVEADALLVRPTGAVLLVLTPHSGHLTMPALAYGAWQVDGLPLPDRADADNPFEQYRQQRPAALAWLSRQMGHAFTDLQGIALFADSLSFGPEVESHLHQHAAAADFQLVGGVPQLLARLRAQAAAPATELPESEILAWADHLTTELTGEIDSTDYQPDNYLTQKLRQLWSWLGAEDIPSDPPYGGGLADATDQQERARLQHLRAELQTELSQQRQEAAAREATRTQELAQLRQQLAQAGLSATERRAEQQATAALEEELRAARAELTARNQELDTRIHQVGLIIRQLQTTGPPAQPRVQPQPTPLSQPVPGVVPAQPRPGPGSPTGRPAPVKSPAFRRLRQAERWGIVGLVLAGVGVGTWGVARLVQQPKARPTVAASHRRNTAFQSAEEPTPNLVYVVDSTLAVPAPADTAKATLPSVAPDPAASTAPNAPAQVVAKQPADSAAGPPAAPPTPDSTAAPSPTP